MPTRPPADAPTAQLPPKNNLAWAIASLALGAISSCLALGLGIVAVVYATRVKGLWAQGHYHAAQAAAKKAKQWAIAGIVVGVVTAVALLVVFALGFGRSQTLFGKHGTSSNSSSYCADLDKFWFAPDGLENILIDVQIGDEHGQPPSSYKGSELQTAAKNAKTLAAEAPTDQLKTDFTNIAETLSAAAMGNYTYHGTGSEMEDVAGSAGHCVVQQGRPGH
jgi:hypothetical protein